MVTKQYKIMNGFYYALNIRNYDGDLSVIDANTESDIITELHQFSEDSNDAIDEQGYDLNEIKWNDFVKEMCAFSKLYPELIFDFHVKYADNDEQSHQYFMNGKYQYCEGYTEFKPFNIENFEKNPT